MDARRKWLLPLLVVLCLVAIVRIADYLYRLHASEVKAEKAAAETAAALAERRIHPSPQVLAFLDNRLTDAIPVLARDFWQS